MSEAVLHLGDCLQVMGTLADGSVDAIISDPPAGIAFMGKEWDGNRGGRDRWVEWLRERMAEALRVAKPGAHALVWALPRTSHWTATALEDAGWRIDDRIAHHFGSGFPKHKSKLKPATEDWWLCTKPGGERWLNVDGCRVTSLDPVQSSAGAVGGYGGQRSGQYEKGTGRSYENTSGRWPTNLVLTHHPECRPNGTRQVRSGIAYEPDGARPRQVAGAPERSLGRECGYASPDGTETVEAWLCVEGCPVAEMDEQSAATGMHSAGFAQPAQAKWAYDLETTNTYGTGKISAAGARIGDSGGASRFYPTFAWEPADLVSFLYCPKASRDDRGRGNTHPTVKPLALMRWLVRLVTRPDDTVLDPFMGSGSTGRACLKEGRRFIGMDSDAESVEIARRRIADAGLPLFDAMEGLAS